MGHYCPEAGTPTCCATEISLTWPTCRLAGLSTARGEARCFVGLKCYPSQITHLPAFGHATSSFIGNTTDLDGALGGIAPAAPAGAG